MAKTEIISSKGRQRGPSSINLGAEIEEEADNNESVPANDEAPKSRREVTDEALHDYMMKMNCGLFPTRGEGFE